MAVGHHQFFVKLKSGASASEIIMEDMELDNSTARNALNDTLSSADTDEEVECNLDSGVGPGHSWLASVRSKYRDSLQKIQDFGSGRRLPPDFHEVMEKCSPKKFLERSRSAKSASSLTKKQSELPSKAKDLVDTPLDTPDCARVVIKPLPLTLYQRKVLKGAVDPTLPSSSMDETSFKDECQDDSHTQRVTHHTVRLQKDAESGFGLVLTCGNTPDTVIAGTYVESVLTASGSEILPGDRLISLNGQNVENQNYLDVAEHLQSLSGSAVLGLLRVTAPTQLEQQQPEQHSQQKVSCSPAETKASEAPSSLNQPSTNSIIIPESDGTMNVSFYNEDDPDPPKPLPRRKKSQKDKICHSSEEEWGHRESLRGGADARQANEPSALNSRCPQVSSTCETSSSNSAESHQSVSSTNNCEGSAWQFDTGWKQDSLLKLIPAPPAKPSSLRNSQYSWNLQRQSASPTSEEDLCGDAVAPPAQGSSEVEGESRDDGGELSWCSSAGVVEMNCLKAEIVPAAPPRGEEGGQEFHVEEDVGKHFSKTNESTEQPPVSRFSVTLTKKDNSFGFRVTERYQFEDEEYERGVFVHSLIPDGAAELNGTIEPGDKLVKINGTRTEGLSYQEAVGLLKKCPQTGKLRFERRDRMIAKWGRRGSRTSLTDSGDVTGEGRPFYGRSVSQGNLSPVYVPTVTPDATCWNSFQDKTSLPRVLNGVIRTSPVSSSTQLPSEQSSTFPRKSKSKSPSLCEDALSDSVFNGSISSSQSSLGPRYLRSESVPVLLSVPRPQRSCSSSPGSPHFLGSVPEDSLLDSFEDAFRSAREADCSTEEIIMNGLTAKFGLESSHGVRMGLVNGGFEEVGIGNQSSILLKEPGQDHPSPSIRKKRAGILEKPEDVFKYLNSGNTFDVLLQKTSRGLGIGIFGGSDLDRLGPVCQLIRVRKIYPLESAVNSGQLCVGDVILEVNGSTTLGLKHTEALELLRVAPVDVRLRIYRPELTVMPPVSYYIKDVSPNSSFLISPPGSACSTLTRPKNPPAQEEYEACLVKKEGSLGFSIFRHERIHDDDIHPTGIYVKALVREPAISHGRIAPGDRILKVNGVDMSNKSHAEAISFLRSASDSVALRLFASSDPLWPQCGEDDVASKPVKPLRKEAVDMLTNRAKFKDGKTSPRRLRQRRNGSDSHSSGDDASELLSCSPKQTSNIPNVALTSSPTPAAKEKEKEKEKNEKNVLDIPTDVGLVRSLRPKSLDGLSFNEKKQSSNGLDRLDNDQPFQRAGSILEPDLNEVGTEGAGLLKWRGATLNSRTDSASQSSESVNLSDLSISRKDTESTTVPSPVPMPPQRIHSLPEADEDVLKRNGHVTGGNDHAPQVVKLFIQLDRGWHGRLGFSLSDILPGEKSNPLSNYTSPVVRAVHPGSIAHKDGRVRVGDRLVMVNDESVVDRPAAEVVDLLRKTRGKIRMNFLRVQSDCDTSSQSSNCS